ncbi:MAG: 5-methylcytosine-specific restriction endonuclease McrA [Rickettsiales bacterium]|jgi:5-methylcytosine-specific restriction endonuclease McrA
MQTKPSPRQIIAIIDVTEKAIENCQMLCKTCNRVKSGK